MARALILTCLFALQASLVEAQSISVCDVRWLGADAVRQAIRVELASLDGASTEGVAIDVEACVGDRVTVRVRRGGALLDEREVDLGDAAVSIRPRLVAYVVAEIVLAAGDGSPVDPAPAVVDDAPAEPAVAERPPREITVVTAVPPLPVPSDYEPGMPWSITAESGIRWYSSARSHLATYRLTGNVGRFLVEVRHVLGPFVGSEASDFGNASSATPSTRYHLVSAGIGFRIRHRIGDDDAIFVDGLGSAGALRMIAHGWTPNPSAGLRYAVAGLEARAGVETGIGRMRAVLSFELGYTKGRRRSREDSEGIPVLQPVDGFFLGATLGIGFADVSERSPD